MTGYINKAEARERMNRWSAEAIPYLFFCDYNQTRFFVEQLKDIVSERLLYDINGRTNTDVKPALPQDWTWTANPPYRHLRIV